MSQGVIALFVVMNLFVPSEYHGIIMTLYFVVFMSVFAMTTMRHQRLGSDAKDIASGKRILVIKQEEVAELQSKDVELVKELKPLLKASGVSLFSMAIIMMWFFVIYPNIIQPYFSASDGIYGQLLRLLTLYEVPVAVSFTIQTASRRLVKRYVNVLRSAEIYNTGIIGKPGFTAKFPIQGYSVKVYPMRKFVDFAKNEGGVEVLFRIYANDIERLVELISRYGKTKVDRIA
ncbi:MAG: DUF2208 domain-containing protein [Sulfolobales archaeon]|nr:DUF2208 domain-containing protein [Sulfolobales archaeon]